MIPRASKTILAAAIAAIVIGGAVYVWRHGGGTKAPSMPTGGAATYRSQNLGISFRYPKEFGRIWERYSDGTDRYYNSSDDYHNDSGLSSIKFVDEHNEATGLDLYPGDGATLRTCDDILKNGFNGGDLLPSNCETVIVDSQPVRIVTFTAGGKSNSAHGDSEQAMFQTKDGVWTFAADNKNLYDDLLDIVQTMEFF